MEKSLTRSGRNKSKLRMTVSVRKDLSPICCLVLLAPVTPWSFVSSSISSSVMAWGTLKIAPRIPVADLGRLHETLWPATSSSLSRSCC